MWHPLLPMKLSHQLEQRFHTLCVLSMMLCLLSFFLYFFTCCSSKSDVPIGFQVMIPIPSVYSMNFTGRAFFLETASPTVPNFKAALSVEKINGSYSCSLQVFIGDFKVWSSGHFSQFKPAEVCMLELTEKGDLQLKGSKGQIGWRSGTSGQGVEQRLQLLGTGDLVLTTGTNLTKWRSFDTPTDVMLWGQRISIATRLTSFPTSTNMFYTFEIQHDKIALLLNSGTLRYSYWDFRPTRAETSHLLIWVQQGSSYLMGNLGFYHYSPTKGKFEASFQALNTTCDLPLACGPYGICTHSNSCSCIQFSRQTYAVNPKCNEGFSTDFCRGGDGVEMVEIMGVSNVLRVPPKRVDVSKEECVNLCIEDCKCSAVLYSVTSSAGMLRECVHYGMVRGLKQVEQRIGLSYLVKVPKGTMIERKKKSSKVKKWLLLMGGVVDGLIILVVVAGFGYYFFVVRKRRIDSLQSESNRNS
ncbi:hypothetical protein Sjap_014275 [Stephania japonica]|uniref:Bulb-type lectin domain-containing protein n=1 Tax=Stephania japonica TaxID=461633 RepID=A0AAP0NZG6_9MAGN